MATVMAYVKDPTTTGGGGQPVRKKLKTSDLPIASATRGAIDALTLSFKKKGNYDALRKQAWEGLQRSVSDFNYRFP